MVISHKTVCEKWHIYRASPLFMHSMMQILEKKNYKAELLAGNISHNSPKQELSLFSKFLKESYNNLGWKEFRPSRWTSKSRASFQFNEVAQGYVQESFKCIQGWQLTNLAWQIFHCFTSSLCRNFFSVYQEGLTFLYWKQNLLTLVFSVCQIKIFKQTNDQLIARTFSVTWNTIINF